MRTVFKSWLRDTHDTDYMLQQFIYYPGKKGTRIQCEAVYRKELQLVQAEMRSPKSFSPAFIRLHHDVPQRLDMTQCPSSHSHEIQRVGDRG